MDKQELDILIDKSILGTLTPNEKSKLEAYIMEQPNTKLEIKMRTDIMKGLEYNADQDLKTILDKIHKEEIAPPKITNLYRQIKVAAIFIGLIVGAFAIFKMTNNTTESIDGQQLYASYYQPYTPSVETRSNNDTLDAVYHIFIDAYRGQDYQKSFETIKPLLADADNQTLLLAGISAMEIGNTEAALQYIKRIIESKDYYFTDHANWYKTLILLKTNKINQAKALLTELANNPKADHHDEAVSLLKEF